MSQKDIWDGSALTEADKTITKVKYEGNEIKANHFICGTSLSSISFIKAITENIKSSGSFIVDIYCISNPCNYANGEDPELCHLKQYKNNVYLINDVCITSFEHTEECQHQLVQLYYNTFKPTDLIILSSMHRSLYHGQTNVPSLYILSETGEKPKFPQPNIVCGLAAGFFNYSALTKTKCCIWEIVEEDFGGSTASFHLWAEKIKDLISIDVSKVSSRAAKFNELRHNDMGLVYT